MHRSSSYQTLLRCYLDFISSWLIPFDPCRVSCILKLERRKKKTYVRLVMCKVVVGRPVTTNDDVCVQHQGCQLLELRQPAMALARMCVGVAYTSPRTYVFFSLVFFLLVYSYMFLFFYRKKNFFVYCHVDLLVVVCTRDRDPCPFSINFCGPSQDNYLCVTCMFVDLHTAWGQRRRLVLRLLRICSDYPINTIETRWSQGQLFSSSLIDRWL